MSHRPRPTRRRTPRRRPHRKARPMTTQTALLPGAKATARDGKRTPVPKGVKKFPDSPYFLLVVLAVHADGTVDVTRDGDGTDVPLGTYVWRGVDPAVLEAA